MKQTKEQLQIALKEKQDEIEHLNIELNNAYNSSQIRYYEGYKDMADKTFSLLSTALTWLLMKASDETDYALLSQVLEEARKYNNG